VLGFGMLPGHEVIFREVGLFADGPLIVLHTPCIIKCVFHARDIVNEVGTNN